MKKTIQFLVIIAAMFTGTKLNAQCIIDAGNNQSICCPGGQVLLVGASSATGCPCPNVSYQWTPTVGLSSPTTYSTYASPSTTTMYYLCVTYLKNHCSFVCCQACDSVLVTVGNQCCRLMSPGKNATGIFASDINLYPNPASTDLTIDISVPLKNAEITMYDVTGRVIWQKKDINDKYKHVIDVSAFPKGVYFVKAIMQGNEVYNNKILIE